MSYSIVYDRQFICSERGITPCVLSGDNNVWEGSGRNMRHARSWSVFQSKLGTSEEELVQLVQPSLGGFQEHWMQNGKWVDDAGLLRWIKTGCAKAASVEDICTINRRRYITCKVSLWSRDEKGNLENSHALHRNVSTTEEFDAWIDEVKNIRQNMELSQDCIVFPIVELSYGNDPIRHPDTKTHDPQEKVLLKTGQQMYAAKVTDSCITSHRDISKAMVISRQEGEALCASLYPTKAWLVSATVKDKYQPVVIQFSDGRFYYKSSARKMWTTPKKETAKVFSTPQAAKRALNSDGMKRYCEKYGVTASVVS